jgi:anti-sigma factor RsiW
MSELPHEELLSAYLDGELTAAEQAQVEQLLATSPRARQLLEELSALSATLQALPRQRLAEDLSGEVLRAIAQHREAAPSLATAAPAAMLPQPMIVPRPLARRVTAWVSVAVAASLLMAVLAYNSVHRGGHSHNEVALAPASDSTPPADKVVSSAESLDARPAPPPAAEAPPPATVEMKIDRDIGRREMAADRAAARADTELAKGALAEQPVLNKAVAPAVAARAAEPPSAPATAPAPAGKPAAPLVAMARSAPAGKMKKAMPRKAEVLQENRAAGDLLVVRCDVAPTGIQKQAFDNVLAQNGLLRQDLAISGTAADATQNMAQVVVTGSGQPELPMSRFAISQNMPGGSAGRAQSSQLAEQSPSGPYEPERANRAGQLLFNAAITDQNAIQQNAAAANAYNDAVVSNLAGNLSNTDQCEMVYLEASPLQLEGTLAQLAAQSDDFPAVEVQPATSAPAQQHWGRYSRVGKATAQERLAGVQAGEKRQEAAGADLAFNTGTLAFGALPSSMAKQSQGAESEVIGRDRSSVAIKDQPQTGRALIDTQEEQAGLRGGKAITANGLVKAGSGTLSISNTGKADVGGTVIAGDVMQQTGTSAVDLGRFAGQPTPAMQSPAAAPQSRVGGQQPTCRVLFVLRRVGAPSATAMPAESKSAPIPTAPATPAGPPPAKR